MGLADYVKLDVLNTGRDDLEAIAEACRAYPDITLLAEKVETEEHLALAEELGCQLLQATCSAARRCCPRRRSPRRSSAGSS